MSNTTTSKLQLPFNQRNVTLLLTITIILSIWLHPSVSAILFESRYAKSWEQFQQQLLTTGTIDSQQFWQTREFYSAGVISFQPGGLSPEFFPPQLQNVASLLIQQYHATPFLYYNAPHFKSLEFLLDKEYEKTVIDMILPLYGETVHFKNERVILSEQNNQQKESLLIFILPAREMQKANGFFDYREKDNAIVANKVWVVLSVITPYLPND
ncbi:hypothetical protein HY468_03560 [Candidatus Roizmanbacteria bacterium]|nr:hypothetical protein [Candidatus Roizmanbacteria bacterium]